jgi:hypothetical protein
MLAQKTDYSEKNKVMRNLERTEDRRKKSGERRFITMKTGIASTGA